MRYSMSLGGRILRRFVGATKGWPGRSVVSGRSVHYTLVHGIIMEDSYGGFSVVTPTLDILLCAQDSVEHVFYYGYL